MVEEQQISAFLEFGKPTFRFRLGDTRARYMRMEAWKHGSMEAWKHGSMEAWKHGSMEAWKHGSMY